MKSQTHLLFKKSNTFIKNLCKGWCGWRDLNPHALRALEPKSSENPIKSMGLFDFWHFLQHAFLRVIDESQTLFKRDNSTKEHPIQCCCEQCATFTWWGD